MAQTVTLMAPADMPQERGVHRRGHDLELDVFRVGEDSFAMADSCPHQGASVSNVKLQGCMVACPAHGLTFDVRTGCSQVLPISSRLPMPAVGGPISMLIVTMLQPLKLPSTT